MAEDLQTQGQSPATRSQQPTVADALTSAATQSREQIMYPDDQPAADAEPKPQAREPSERQAKPLEKAQAKESGQAEPNAAADEFKLEMPEGVQIDQELLNAAAPVLKEIGVSSDQAQQLVPLVNQVQERFQQTQLDYFMALQKDWVSQAMADREIGGSKWTETTRLARVAISAGGSGASLQEAQQVLNESGVGNHPALIRLFRNMGAEIERLRGGRSGSSLSVLQNATDRHQKHLYPNDPPKR